MRSKFPQQKLLEVRRRAADDAEQAFVNARRRFESCREAEESARADLKRSLTARTTVAEHGLVARLASSEAFVKRMREEVERAARELVVAEEEAKAAKRLFSDASVALKAIEKLQEKWAVEEARRLGRRAEAVLDETATARFVREREKSR